MNLPSCVPLASVSLSLLASPSTSLDHLICLQVTIFKSLLLSFVGVQNWHCQWGPFPSHSTPIQDETGREKCKKPTVTRHSIKTRDLAEGASLWVSPASLNWNVQEACRSFTAVHWTNRLAVFLLFGEVDKGYSSPGVKGEWD